MAVEQGAYAVGDGLAASIYAASISRDHGTD